MTLTIEVKGGEEKLVQKLAHARGLAVNEFAQQHFTESLRREEALETAAAYVLKKNEDLYKRLAK